MRLIGPALNNNTTKRVTVTVRTGIYVDANFVSRCEVKKLVLLIFVWTLANK